eukprot:TRINITY_DN65715_c3_g5_i2.p1 TRINITY_DN65715_c3_g5~~TRINITY_DN65715_c3_g5_i2.p1  ORF type:complete len:860 (+),score=410.82 TRINITY_DN65715_c3_g5_i2:86-2581(+)
MLAALSGLAGDSQPRSVVGNAGFISYDCPYCKKTNGCHAFCFWAFALTIRDFEYLVERGWCRSGRAVYLPLNGLCCCPQYSLRVRATQFRPSKRHRRAVRRLDRFKHSRDALSFELPSIPNSMMQLLISQPKAQLVSEQFCLDPLMQQHAASSSLTSSSTPSSSSPQRTAVQPRRRKQPRQQTEKSLPLTSLLLATSVSASHLADAMVFLNTTLRNVLRKLALLDLLPDDEQQSDLIQLQRDALMPRPKNGHCSTNVAMKLAAVMARRQRENKPPLRSGTRRLLMLLNNTNNMNNNNNTTTADLKRRTMNIRGTDTRQVVLQLAPIVQQYMQHSINKTLSDNLRAQVGAIAVQLAGPGFMNITFQRLPSQSQSALSSAAVASATSGDIQKAIADAMAFSTGKLSSQRSDSSWSIPSTSSQYSLASSASRSFSETSISSLSSSDNSASMMSLGSDSSGSSNNSSSSSSSSSSDSKMHHNQHVHHADCQHSRIRTSWCRVFLSPQLYFLYARYQTKIHHDDPASVTQKQFQNFLVETPLVGLPPQSQQCPVQGYGSFYRLYEITDPRPAHPSLEQRVIGAGMVDVLTKGLYSSYFLWEPRAKSLSLGTESAVREIEMVQAIARRNPSFQHYYMGYYVHDSVKMAYKTQFEPAEVFCPIAQQWVPLSQAMRVLNTGKHESLLTNVCDAMDERNDDDDDDVKQPQFNNDFNNNNNNNSNSSNDDDTSSMDTAFSSMSMKPWPSSSSSFSSSSSSSSPSQHLAAITELNDAAKHPDIDMACMANVPILVNGKVVRLSQVAADSSTDPDVVVVAKQYISAVGAELSQRMFYIAKQST